MMSAITSRPWAGLNAAKMQHEVAMQLRVAILASQYGTPRELARQHPDISYERLRALLSGDAWMRFEDMAAVAAILGLELHMTLLGPNRP